MRPTRPTPWIQGLYARLLYARLLNTIFFKRNEKGHVWKNSILTTTTTYWFLRPCTSLTHGQQMVLNLFSFKKHFNEWKHFNQNWKTILGEISLHAGGMTMKMKCIKILILIKLDFLWPLSTSAKRAAFAIKYQLCVRRIGLQLLSL